MNRNRYMKSLWASLVIAWSCVVPLMGQLPANGVLNGNYKLTANATISNTLTVGTSNAATIDLNGYVLTKTGSGFIMSIGVNKVLTITDSRPSVSNTGKYGINDTQVTINGGVITGGSGDRGGAAIVSGTLNLNGGTIAGCTTSDDFSDTHPETGTNIHVMTQGCGGAVYLQASTDGGGYAGKLVMDGGHIAYCQTQHTDYVKGEVIGLGGAVFIDSEGSSHGTFELKSGSIYGCVAGVGGAVYVHSPQENGDGKGGRFIMSGGSIHDCAAVYDVSGRNYGGGAVFVSSLIDTDENVKGKGSFTMSGGEIYRNETNGDGNGVYSNGIFTMSGTAKIHKNRPYDWTDKANADSYPYEEKTSQYYEGTVNMTYGGGVFIYKKGAEFTMTGGSIDNNYGASGGGVMVWNDAVFTMSDGTITKNHAIGKATVGNGGAVYVQNSTFNFNGGTLSYNTARRYGGAININQNAKLYLNSGTIQGNTASHGGGLSQEQGECVMELKSGIEIIENKAHGMFPIYSELTAGDDLGNGGGVFIEKGKLIINDGVTISDNYATNKGGGVSLYVSRIGGDIEVVMDGGDVSGNKANKTGGGIDVYADKEYEGEEDAGTDGNTINNVKVYINDGTFSNNSANVGGGAHIGVNTANSVAGMEIGKEASVPHIDENTASESGGGFAMDNTGDTEANMGTVTIHKGKLTANEAVNGGGFYVKNGQVTITTCEISGNTASEYGGGLYVYNDTEKSQDVTFSGGDFVANTAKYGGGVALKGNINLTMSGNIESNTATNGGGLYLGQGGSMQFGKGLIRNNHAILNTIAMSAVTAYGKTVSEVTGIGGGLFMDSNTSLEFTNNNELGLYGNIANNGADDIFANGKGTSVTLPNVTKDETHEGMNLTDFKVEVDKRFLFWVKDYITNDTEYKISPAGIDEEVLTNGNVRYRNAKATDDYWKLAAGTYTGYISVALGYRLLYATITKEGLVDGESAIFKVYRGTADDNGENISFSTKPYATVLLTGKNGQVVSKRIAVTEGPWKVVETKWSWNYDTSQPEDQLDGKNILEKNTEKENTFEFTNTIKGAAKKTYDEDIEVNVMNTSTSNTGGGSTPAE